MTEQEVTNYFKKLLIQSKLPVNCAYLFGSRAKKNATADSDWDFLVVLEERKKIADLHKAKVRLRMKFHDRCPYPIDIVIKNKTVFGKEKLIPNTVSFNAAREGLLL